MTDRLTDKALADMKTQLDSLAADSNPSSQSPLTLGEAQALVAEVLRYRSYFAVTITNPQWGTHK